MKRNILFILTFTLISMNLMAAPIENKNNNNDLNKNVETSEEKVITDRDNTSAFQLKLNTGRYSLSGGASLGYSTYSGTFLTLAPRFEYFLKDSFSVGAKVVASGSSSEYYNNTLSFGPSATYYFWQKNHFTTYVGGSYVLGLYGKYATPNRKVDLDLGANYNFNQHFGLGPKESYVWYPAGGSYADLNLALFFYL